MYLEGERLRICNLQGPKRWRDSTELIIWSINRHDKGRLQNLGCNRSESHRFCWYTFEKVDIYDFKFVLVYAFWSGTIATYNVKVLIYTWE